MTDPRAWMDSLAADVPREAQTIALAPSEIDRLRPWAEDGTALTASARVTDPDGRIALVKNRWSDGWFLPGGAVEPGETPRAAARREVREETGLSATVGDPVVVLEQDYRDETADCLAFSAAFVVFAASADGAIPDAATLGTTDDEIRAARWFASLPENLHDGTHLRSYLEPAVGEETA